MTNRNICLLLLLFVVILAGCRTEQPMETRGPLGTTVPTTAAPTVEAPAGPGASPALSPTPTPTPAPDPMAERVAGMTTEELAGQVLVAGLQGTEPGEDARQVLEELRVGGVILFGRNVESPEQLTELTNTLKVINREAGNAPLFLCVDEEGGTVSRMPGSVTDLPNAYD